MIAANFPAALAFTLAQEGGWSDNPDDPGGPTMKGVTLATFRAYHHGATADDLRHISDRDLGDIYRHGYWNACKCDDLPSGIDLAVFDMAVNAGPGRSTRLLQSAANVTADGVLGPISIKAIAGADPLILIGELWHRQIDYYRGLPSWRIFGHGWAARTLARRAEAMKLAGAIGA